MARLKLDLLAEDYAHEAVLSALIERLADEVGKKVVIAVRTARGGQPRVQRELKLYQQGVFKGLIDWPDILVVAKDSNCHNFNEARKDIINYLDPKLSDILVIACPEPHIERWLLTDLEAFARVIGVHPRISQEKCERDYYKSALVQAIKESGQVPILGGVEFAREIVKELDLYRAKKQDRSLGAFIDDFVGFLKRL